MPAKRFVLRSQELIQPYFALSGRNRKTKIPGMPEIFRMSPDRIVRDVEILLRAGGRRILLFGIARAKDPMGVESFDGCAAIQQTVRDLKKTFGKEVVIITDVCLCGFTDHGHCGILRGKRIDREKTLAVLGRIAVSHAQAGADFVAPSAMTRGQVKAVRFALDRA